MTEQTEASPAPGDSPHAASSAHLERPDRDGRDLVVIVPVLSRPHRIRPLLESIVRSGVPGVRVSIIGTTGDTPTNDEALFAARYLMARCDILIDVAWIPANTRGDYAVKINHGYRHTREPFMLLAADDLAFHPGWWQAARHLFNDQAVSVVGTNDLGSQRVMAGTHATHPIVRREYIDLYGTIDEPGKVLHEGYWHEFVDDEFVATAKLRGAYAHASDSIVEHLHPSWGKAPMDDLYALQRTRMKAGRRVFEERKHLWNA